MPFTKKRLRLTPFQKRHILFGLALLGLLYALPARAVQADPDLAMERFAAHCFSPYLTAEAAKALATDDIRVDFYDLQPFVAGRAISPVTGRAATTGTDRRCEISFDGTRADDAAAIATHALEAEGIRTPAALPPSHTRTSGTSLLAARRLNPSRIAVVHTGTRPRTDTLETFLLVERLTPQASAQID